MNAQLDRVARLNAAVKLFRIFLDAAVPPVHRVTADGQILLESGLATLAAKPPGRLLPREKRLLALANRLIALRPAPITRALLSERVGLLRSRKMLLRGKRGRSYETDEAEEERERLAEYRRLLRQPDDPLLAEWEDVFDGAGIFERQVARLDEESEDLMQYVNAEQLVDLQLDRLQAELQDPDMASLELVDDDPMELSVSSPLPSPDELLTASNDFPPPPDVEEEDMAETEEERRQREKAAAVSTTSEEPVIQAIVALVLSVMPARAVVYLANEPDVGRALQLRQTGPDPRVQALLRDQSAALRVLHVDDIAYYNIGGVRTSGTLVGLLPFFQNLTTLSLNSYERTHPFEREEVRKQRRGIRNGVNMAQLVRSIEYLETLTSLDVPDVPIGGLARPQNMRRLGFQVTLKTPKSIFFDLSSLEHLDLWFKNSRTYGLFSDIAGFLRQNQLRVLGLYGSPPPKGTRATARMQRPVPSERLTLGNAAFSAFYTYQALTNVRQPRVEITRPITTLGWAGAEHIRHLTLTVDPKAVLVGTNIADLPAPADSHSNSSDASSTSDDHSDANKRLPPVVLPPSGNDLSRLNYSRLVQLDLRTPHRRDLQLDATALPRVEILMLDGFRVTFGSNRQALPLSVRILVVRRGTLTFTAAPTGALAALFALRVLHLHYMITVSLGAFSSIIEELHLKNRVAKDGRIEQVMASHALAKFPNLQLFHYDVGPRTAYARYAECNVEFFLRDHLRRIPRVVVGPTMEPYKIPE